MWDSQDQSVCSILNSRWLNAKLPQKQMLDSTISQSPTFWQAAFSLVFLPLSLTSVTQAGLELVIIPPQISNCLLGYRPALPAPWTQASSLNAWLSSSFTAQHLFPPTSQSLFSSRALETTSLLIDSPLGTFSLYKQTHVACSLFSLAFFSLNMMHSEVHLCCSMSVPHFCFIVQLQCI